MLSDPALLPHFSATTMLATTGHDCFMKPFSTSRHEEIFCGIVPPLTTKAVHYADYYDLDLSVDYKQNNDTFLLSEK
jgi:hypothetical protein